MEEAFIALGILGPLLCRQRHIELFEHPHGIDHYVLGNAGMDIEATCRHIPHRSIEALVVELADPLSVYGIAPPAAQLLDIEQTCTVADLLIRHESQLQRGMGLGRIFQKACCQLHDLCHSTFIIRPQKRRAIRADDILADIVGEPRRLLLVGRDLVALCIESDVEGPSLIVHDMRLHASGLHIGRHIVMGAEQKRRQRFCPLGCRNRRGHVGMLIDRDVVCAHLFQILRHDARAVELAGSGGGMCKIVLVRGRIYPGIGNEAVCYSAHDVISDAKKWIMHG